MFSAFRVCCHSKHVAQNYTSSIHAFNAPKPAYCPYSWRKNVKVLNRLLYLYVWVELLEQKAASEKPDHHCWLWWTLFGRKLPHLSFFFLYLALYHRECRHILMWFVALMCSCAGLMSSGYFNPSACLFSSPVTARGESKWVTLPDALFSFGGWSWKARVGSVYLWKGSGTLALGWLEIFALEIFVSVSWS